MTSLEKNEEFITNMLQKEISRLLTNKKELEALLSQEQNVILNSLCLKVSQQISEKLELQRKYNAELEVRSNSASEEPEDFETSSESDMDDSRTSDDLKALRKKLHRAKQEMLKYKHLYEQLQSSESKLLRESQKMLSRSVVGMPHLQVRLPVHSRSETTSLDNSCDMSQSPSLTPRS
mmetsp:Transcript_2099/g.5113  ORF Transcript_2099/g.5113 Transcript_2099/m.5113 type:complete len:178 (-) Transcript_2099:9319-9852(-)